MFAGIHPASVYGCLRLGSFAYISMVLLLLVVVHTSVNDEMTAIRLDRNIEHVWLDIPRKYC
jgi:hypothetical protein